MDINGYRFEIISVSDYRLNGGKWDKARVLNLGFGDGKSDFGLKLVSQYFCMSNIA